MSNVSNPSGPLNSNPSPRSTEPVRPGTDKFKDFMKIDKSDEKQKKKKKRPEEIEEEEKAKLQAQASVKEETTGRIERKGTFPSRGPKGEVQKASTPSQESVVKTPQEITSSSTRAEADLLSAQATEERAQEATQQARENITLKSRQQEKSQEEERLEQQAPPAPMAPSMTSAPSKRKETPGAPLGAAPPPLLPEHPLLLPSAEAPPAYTQLHPETLALFEKMVAVMTILHTSGITETVLHLTSPEFAQSSLAGAQVVIREFETAPLSYNIELLAPPQGMALLQKNLPLLKTAFREGKYRFRVNRLEAALLEEKSPPVSRKPSASEDERAP